MKFRFVFVIFCFCCFCCGGRGPGGVGFVVSPFVYDGVSEHVVKYVFDRYTDVDVQRVLLDYARGIEEFISCDEDVDEILKVVHFQVEARACVYFNYSFNEASGMLKDIRRVVLNSEDKMRVYLARDALISGYTFELPRNDGYCGGKDL